MAKTDFATALENVYAQYNKRGYVHPDPLEYLYRYEDLRDREIAGLVASSLAYGNVKQIIRNVGIVLDKMGGSPRAYVGNKSHAQMKKDFENFKYRFTEGYQMAALLAAAKKLVSTYGTLGDCAARHETDVQREFARQLYSAAPEAINTLIPSPDKDSALKRLNLYFRWMCRTDEVDPGGWEMSPAKLVVPLDTHMHQIAKAFCLTARNDAGMKTALEITASFARFSPDDPVKYDFCLTRFGIRDELDLAALRKCMA
jgi:uncharacterized protein (TIGR02757 family)